MLPDDAHLANSLVARGLLSSADVTAASTRAGQRGLGLRALLEQEGWGPTLQALAPPAPATEPGSGRHGSGRQRIGPYELVAELGRGGFGVVHRARDPLRRREVALKVLSTLDERARRRFAREVQATARLTHPGVARLFESGEAPEQGLAWMATELVPGGSLVELARRGIAPEEAARLLAQVARAVAHAHAHGVLHRDLKPHHVLIGSDGAPRVIDFGLAWLAEGGERLTRTGAPLGTPAYMSPEQVDPSRRAGRPLDARCDVWGLGATLYHALTGRAPFQAASPELTLAAVLEQEPTPPDRLDPRVPAPLAAVCLRALEKEPRRRYPGAAELADDLERFLRGEPVLAAAGRAARRGVRALGLALGVALVAGGSAAAIVRARRPGPQAPGPTALPAPTQEPPEGRRRRLEVEALLQRARREPLALDEAAALAGIAAAGPDAAGPLLALLAEATQALGASEEEALRAAANDEEEAGLAAALEARRRTPLSSPPDPAAEAAREAALRRLTGPPVGEPPRASSGRQALAALQGAALGEGRVAAVRLACRALGRLREPRGVPALAAYLQVETDEVRAAAAGEALVEVAGPEALALAAGAAVRATPEGPLETRLRRALAKVAFDPPLPEESARGHLFRAGQRRALGKLVEALADCDEAVRRSPELAEAWALRGAIEAERGDLRRAIQDLDRALALRPDEARWMARRGDARRRVRPPDLSGAWNDLRRAEALAPDDPAVRLLIGSGLDEPQAAAATAESADAWAIRSARRYEQGDFAAALEAAEKALAIDPGHAVALSNRAAARLAQGDLPGGASDLARAVELDPQNAGTWANLGAARYQLGDLRGALAACDRALQLQPKTVSALNTRAVLRHVLGESRAALEDVNLSLKLEPWRGSAWTVRAGIRRATGDVPGAVEDARRGVELETQDPNGWNTLSHALGDAGKLAEALEAIERAIALAPRMAAYRLHRGEVRFKLGDRSGGLEDLDRAVELDPKDPVSWATRGAFRQEVGRLDLAVEDFSRAIELAPQDAGHRSRRGVIRLQMGDLAGAEADCAQALGADPRHAVSWMRRAFVSHARGDRKRAIEDASRALELEPRMTDGWMVRARLRLESGDRAGAAADFRKFLEVAPESPQAAEVRQVLAKLEGG